MNRWKSPLLFNIDIADLRAPLDAEEMSRMTIEDEYTLIIVDVPIKGRAEQSDLLRDDSARDYPNRRGYHHDLLREIATSRYLYQPTLAEFLYLYAIALLSFRSSIATLNSTCQRFVPWIAKANRLKANCTNQRVMKS